MSVVVIALVIAIVVVVNLMSSLLSKRYPMKLDLTPDKRYELTDETKTVLEELDKDVEITVTSTKDTFTSMASYFKQLYASYYGINVDMPYDMIPEILDKYSVYAEAGDGSVSVRYVDINKDPDVISGFNKFYNGEIAEGREKMLEETRSKMSLDDLFSQIKEGNLKELNLIVKADVQGSVEAVKQSLLKLSNDEVVVK